MQTKYLSRTTNITGAGSGVEQLHQLGFDASQDFRMYGLRGKGNDATVRAARSSGSWTEDPRAEGKGSERSHSKMQIIRTCVWATSGWFAFLHLAGAGFRRHQNRFPRMSAQYKRTMYTEVLTDDSHGRTTCVMPICCEVPVVPFRDTPCARVSRQPHFRRLRFRQ
jgi:hypothetical protein